MLPVLSEVVFCGWVCAAIAAAATLVGGFFLGFLLGKRKTPPESLPVEIEGGEEADDPTAPISPVVEMARSPHDRHRDLAVGNSLIKQIDFVESMLKHAEKKGDGELEKQLQILRNEFLDLLDECAIEAFVFSPGTVIDTEVRNRIQIVGGEVKGDRSVVAETVQRGYLYLHGDDQTMIVRKAEIMIG